MQFRKRWLFPNVRTRHWAMYEVGSPGEWVTGQKPGKRRGSGVLYAAGAVLLGVLAAAC